MAEQTESAVVAGEKITVSLSPIGSAPVLKQKKFAVSRDKSMGWLNQWLRKNLKCEAAESVFVYVQHSFSPALDTNLGALYDCYGSNGKLTLAYSKMRAYG